MEAKEKLNTMKLQSDNIPLVGLGIAGFFQIPRLKVLIQPMNFLVTPRLDFSHSHQSPYIDLLESALTS